METPILSTVKQFSKKNPAFPEGGLRHRIFHAEENGMEELGVVVRDGRSVLIHDERYFLRIELKNTGEFDTVRRLIREAKKQGKYLSPEDAVAQIRQTRGVS